MQKRENLLVEINQICNLSCAYCFYHERERSKRQMSLQLFCSILESHPRKLFITGGEPFLNPDIVGMIYYSDKKGIDCSIFTNGILLPIILKDNPEILSQVSRFIVSFDSHLKDYKLRGKSSEVLKAIDKILAFDSRILEVKIGLTKYNISCFSEIVSFLENRGVSQISINLIHNIFGSELDFDIKYANELKDCFSLIKSKKHLFNQRYSKAHQEFIENKFDSLVRTCKAWHGFSFVNCDGEEFGCPATMQKAEIQNKMQCLSERCINLWEMY